MPRLLPRGHQPKSLIRSNLRFRDYLLSGTSHSYSLLLAMLLVSLQKCYILIPLVKQIIHIELCEAEFKRKKVELEKGKDLSTIVNMCSSAKQNDAEPKSRGNKESDDLEMIGGTSEDDFSEAIALVRYLLVPVPAEFLQRKGATLRNPVFTRKIRTTFGGSML